MTKNIIQVYCTENAKEEIEEAAAIISLSVGAFCRMIILQEARRILRESEATHDNEQSNTD